MGVPGRPSTEHVAQGINLPGSGMDNLFPSSKGDHRHKRHLPDGDTVECIGGADQYSPPRQPTDAQLTPRVQGWKRYRDGYNVVKDRPGACQHIPGPYLTGIPGPLEVLVTVDQDRLLITLEGYERGIKCGGSWRLSGDASRCCRVITASTVRPSPPQGVQRREDSCTQ